MSHISETPIRFDDREAIVKMCELLPEQFTFHDSKTFRSYSTESCDFCISVQGARYQVGFRRQADGTLMPAVDWWTSGGLKDALGGTEMPVLTRGYNLGKIALETKRLGYESAVAHMPDGNYKMLVTKQRNKHRSGWRTALKKLATGRLLGGQSHAV